MVWLKASNFPKEMSSAPKVELSGGIIMSSSEYMKLTRSSKSSKDLVVKFKDFVKAGRMTKFVFVAVVTISPRDHNNNSKIG